MSKKPTAPKSETPPRQNDSFAFEDQARRAELANALVLAAANVRLVANPMEKGTAHEMGKAFRQAAERIYRELYQELSSFSQPKASVAKPTSEPALAE